MGAWGSGAFENDDACDWAYELEDGGVDLLREAFELAEGNEYLEAPDGSMLVAAAEVVAAAAGKPSAEKLPDEVVAFLARKPEVDDDLLEAARKAVARVLGEGSELADLWKDAEPEGGWRAKMNDLARRLGA